MSYPAENLSLSNIWAVSTDTSTLRTNLLDLICQEAYGEGNFTLSSGQPSSYYINCKPVTLNPLGAVAVGRLILKMLSDDTEAVAGLTLGADPIVSAVSVVSTYENRPIPGLIIRKESKGHGTQAYIEGPILPSGAKIVVLEDVVTTGQSAMKAVTRLRDAGYTVDEVISLVDRKQGGAEFYQSQGLKFNVVYEIEEIQRRYSLKD
ncbi:orotate phosphoribosyltransferase [Calothrix sp. PCC 6303]|uniref:orotate phosphoribosyltransferase n=1 Tax=Calothrix sp. PCC 6303 TaxID=1170562 RepID=UPI0002A03CD6|nr:orotate phosphoribosyltransferase [Calothrix sp. PCC 6303]AFY99738.1 orotate phosphoribosyltransferase [Calothrix sp. PCC 6303]